MSTYLWHLHLRFNAKLMRQKGSSRMDKQRKQAAAMRLTQAHTTYLRMT